MWSALSEWQPDAVVTIASPRYRVRPIEGVRHLRLMCHDVEVYRHGRRFGPNARHVDQVRGLARSGPARLLIHCTAGLSRSPAFAIVAMLEAGATASDACSRMRAAVPHASPNRLALRLADASFEMDGELTRAADQAFTFTRSAYGAVGERSGFVEIVAT